MAFFTVLEVAVYLNVTPQTVYNWLQHKQLRSCKAGRKYRITQQQVDDFLLNNTVEKTRNDGKWHNKPKWGDK